MTSTIKPFTHKHLTQIAARWLRTRKGCGIVLREFMTGGCRGRPDAIGWRCGARWSYVVECKRTRADFFHDTEKLCHTNADLFRVGEYGYYLVPAGLVAAHEVPLGWGLVEVGDDGECVVVKEATQSTVNRLQEIGLMYSALLRWRHEDVTTEIEDALDTLARLRDLLRVNNVYGAKLLLEIREPEAAKGATDAH